MAKRRRKEWDPREGLFIFTGGYADVEDKDGTDHGVKDFDWLNGNYDSLQELNKQLEDFDFPPLQDWGSEEEGHFYVDRQEDNDGSADPEGEFSVRYTAKVYVTSTPKPFTFGKG